MVPETKHYAQISSQEFFQILISSLIVGFALSFRDWGTTELDVNAGITSLIVTSIIALIIILLRVAVQKLLAIKEGYFLTYNMHRWGVAASVFLTFFFNGSFILPFFPAFVTPGEINVQASKRLRLGRFRYGLMLSDLTKIAVAGTLVSVLLMIPIHPIAMITNNFFIYKIVEVSAAIAIYSLIPIPGSDGFHILYYKRWLWVLIFSFVLIYFILILFLKLFSYLIALVLAIAITIIYKKQIN